MKSFILFVFLMTTTAAQADQNFLPLRKDFNVPGHCQDIGLKEFSGPLSWFTVGRKGAEDFGFTYEIPLERQDATILWDFMKSVAKDRGEFKVWKEILQDTELHGHYRNLMAHHKGMGVQFGNEGEVLEVLASEALRLMFPAPQYFVTGGVEYRNGAGGRTIGEVDVMIGDAKSCQIVMVGEVKLGGSRSLSKAKSQLFRFSNFLNDFGHPGLKDEIDLANRKSCAIPAVL